MKAKPKKITKLAAKNAKFEKRDRICQEPLKNRPPDFVLEEFVITSMKAKIVSG